MKAVVYFRDENKGLETQETMPTIERRIFDSNAFLKFRAVGGTMFIVNKAYLREVHEAMELKESKKSNLAKKEDKK